MSPPMPGDPPLARSTSTAHQMERRGARGLTVALALGSMQPIISTLANLHRPWPWSLVFASVLLGLALIAIKVLIRRPGTDPVPAMVTIAGVTACLVTGVLIYGGPVPQRANGTRPDLDGLVAYLLVTAGILGLARFRAQTGTAIVAVSAFTWSLLPNGRTPWQLLSDGLGMLLVYWAVSGTTRLLRQLAAEIDEVHVTELRHERMDRRRWFHDPVVRVLERASRNEMSDQDRRDCLSIAGEIRDEELHDPRRGVAGDMSSGLRYLIQRAGDRGIALDVRSQLVDDPSDSVVTQTVIFALLTLLTNVADHACVGSARLNMRST